jgi:hypothetical protein
MSEGGDKKSGCSNAVWQGGCAGCGCVLTLGLILALIGGSLGIALTVRVPGTQSNVTVTGSVGKKELTKDVLPRYARRTFGDNTNFINSSNSLTIGPAQGRQQFVVGEQPGAPVAGIDVEWKSK